MKKILLNLFSLLLISSVNLSAQNQKGLDIDGEAAYDNSGRSVSMPDVNTIAIGAPSNKANGTDAGQVRIYKWNGLIWSQKGIDIDGDTTSNYFGYSVSMPDSSTVAIGAPINSSNTYQAGQVKIYKWSGSAWIQKGINIEGEDSLDWTGNSVSMPDSNTIAVGTLYKNDNGTNSGQVRIYKWNGLAWVQRGVDLDGEAAHNYFGNSVDMPDSNTVAIGANGNDNANGNSSGHVRIYKWNGLTWRQIGADIDGEAAYDESGSSISMPDTNTIAIGAKLNDGNGTYSGHTRIYKWNGIAWVQKGVDIDGEATGDQSGFSVTMPDSNTIAIGAIHNDDNGIKSGHVRIYKWSGTAWYQKGIDIDGEAADDWSGQAVSMPDTNTISIGAIYNNGTGTNAGHTRVYVFCKDTTLLSPSACNSYTSPSGKIWTTSATYLDTVININGCENFMTIKLNIDTVNANVSDSTTFLTADASNATYQWVDCNNFYSPIVGDTNQSFTPRNIGNYAVIVTQNGCVDTSICYNVVVVSLNDNKLSEIKIFPNPTDGEVVIDFGRSDLDVKLKINTIEGKLIQEHFQLNSHKVLIDLTNQPKGIYLVTLQSEESVRTIKVVKK